MMGWEGSPSFSRVALNDFFFVRMCNVFQSPFCVILQYFLSPPFLSSPSFLFGWDFSSPSVQFEDIHLK